MENNHYQVPECALRTAERCAPRLVPLLIKWAEDTTRVVPKGKIPESYATRENKLNGLYNDLVLAERMAFAIAQGYWIRIQSDEKLKQKYDPEKVRKAYYRFTRQTERRIENIEKMINNDFPSADMRRSSEDRKNQNPGKREASKAVVTSIPQVIF